MQQTITAGTTVSIALNMVGNDGAHVSGVIDTASTRLQKGDTSDTTWNSVVPTVDTVATGVFRVNFTGLNPAVSVSHNDDRVRLKVNGSAGGVAFTEYHLPLTVLMSNDSVENLQKSAGVIVPGTVASGVGYIPTQTTFLSDITEQTDDHYNSRVILFTSGNLDGQVASISDYTTFSGSGQFTVTAMTEAPANGDPFIIV